jgi:predicted phage terminase large subunit-like protein
MIASPDLAQQLRRNWDSLLLAKAARDRLKVARKSLPAFIEYLCLGYSFAAHHKLLMQALEEVERGEVTRLMVLMPPGSAKSTYASVLFPPWFMGRNPQMSVLGVSNTADLAERFSRRVRNLVALQEYRNVFEGNGVSADSAAAGSWETLKGGEFFAAGMGGAIAGRRADLGLIDDPIKTRQEADSERVRQTQWDWYVNDFLTRLKPGARQILIQTRWHEDDLGGRILEREAERWKVIKIPMLATENDPLGRKLNDRLWPEWFTDEMVATAKMDVRAWNALYQQEPVPDEGDYFKKDNFSEYGAHPNGLHVYGCSDYAVTEGDGDFTEHGIFGIDTSGNPFVLDWWRGQKSSDVWIEAQCDLIKRWEPLCWFGEAGPIRRAIEPFLHKRMMDRQAHCRLEWLPSISDKVIRARSIQALASVKTIAFPKQAPWKADVLKQLLQFPSGKHDDAVDVFSLLGRGLEFVTKPRKPKVELRQGGVTSGWSR